MGRLASNAMHGTATAKRSSALLACGSIRASAKAPPRRKVILADLAIDRHGRRATNAATSPEDQRPNPEQTGETASPDAARIAGAARIWDAAIRATGTPAHRYLGRTMRLAAQRAGPAELRPVAPRRPCPADRPRRVMVRPSRRCGGRSGLSLRPSWRGAWRCPVRGAGRGRWAVATPAVAPDNPDRWRAGSSRRRPVAAR